ncbi:MAG: YdcF family protein [Clostridia bacterium]|nr:YdcF family protein [Clostridia bacterium]
MLRSKKLRIVLISALSLAVLGCILLLTLNFIVIGRTAGDIDTFSAENRYTTAIVLGAKVHKGGRLSDMLRDRMETAIALYHAGTVDTLLLSGDGRGEWSEVKYMKLYAMEKGVPEDAILEDPEGFSTYESISRAKELYHLDSLLIVTQKYHLYRAIYIAEDLDMYAKGASADLETYAGQFYRDIREILARIKDFGLCLFN